MPDTLSNPSHGLAESSAFSWRASLFSFHRTKTWPRDISPLPGSRDIIDILARAAKQDHENSVVCTRSWPRRETHLWNRSDVISAPCRGPGSPTAEHPRRPGPLGVLALLRADDKPNTRIRDRAWLAGRTEGTTACRVWRPAVHCLNGRRHSDDVRLPLATSVLLSTVGLIRPFSLVHPFPPSSLTCTGPPHVYCPPPGVRYSGAQVCNLPLLYRPG